MSKKSKIISLEQKIKILIRSGKSEEQICEFLLSDENKPENIHPKDIIDKVKLIVSNYPMYSQIQDIMEGYLIYIMGRRDRDELYVFNPKTRKQTKMSKEGLSDLFEKDAVDLKEKKIFAFKEYNYKNREKLRKDEEGNWLYNTYTPPFWLKDYFNCKIDKVPYRGAMPPQYERFLKHLVNNDEKCFTYVVNWMANSIQDRNIPFLIAIGPQGVGKTKLADILAALHGEENSAVAESTILTEKFNPQYDNKRFVYMDEIEAKGKKEANRLKALTNDRISVEKKQLDAESKDNYASAMISSNSYDSLRFENKNRRFSIIEIAKQDLQTVMTVEEIIALSKDNEAIRELGYYLWHYKVDYNLFKTPFQGEMSQKLRDLSLEPYETFLIDEYAKDKAGQSININSVVNYIDAAVGKKPSRRQLEDLINKLPGYFEIVRKKDKFDKEGNKRIYCIDFKPLNEQPKDRD